MSERSKKHDEIEPGPTAGNIWLDLLPSLVIENIFEHLDTKSRSSLELASRRCASLVADYSSVGCHTETLHISIEHVVPMTAPQQRLIAMRDPQLIFSLLIQEWTISFEGETFTGLRDSRAMAHRLSKIMDKHGGVISHLVVDGLPIVYTETKQIVFSQQLHSLIARMKNLRNLVFNRIKFEEAAQTYAQLHLPQLCTVTMRTAEGFGVRYAIRWLSACVNTTRLRFEFDFVRASPTAVDGPRAIHATLSNLPSSYFDHIRVTIANINSIDVSDITSLATRCNRLELFSLVDIYPSRDDRLVRMLAMLSEAVPSTVSINILIGNSLEQVKRILSPWTGRVLLETVRDRVVWIKDGGVWERGALDNISLLSRVQAMLSVFKY